MAALAAALGAGAAPALRELNLGSARFFSRSAFFMITPAHALRD